MKGGESGAIACFGSEPERYGRTNTIHMKHNQILVCGYAALERRDHLPSRVRPTCLVSSGQELIIVGEGGRRCTLGSDVGGWAVGFVLYRPIRIELVRSGTLGVRSCSSRCRDGGLLSSVCSPCLRRMSSGANVIHPLHPISCMRTNLSFATEFVSVILLFGENNASMHIFRYYKSGPSPASRTPCTYSISLPKSISKRKACTRTLKSFR